MLHAEWTKLRTLSSTAWLLIAAVGLTVAGGAATAAGVDTGFCGPAAECPADLTKLSLTGIWFGQAVVAVLAALAVTNEYGTGTIAVTLAAHPRRGPVLLAKAGVVTALALGTGALAVAGSLLAGWAILPTGGFTTGSGYPWLSLTAEPTLRAGAGTVLYLGLIALLSLGVGTVVRDTGGAIATILGLLYLFPLATLLISDPQWRDWLERIGPATAGQAIQATTDLDQLPIGPWAGLGVLAAWAAAALLLGALTLHARDA